MQQYCVINLHAYVCIFIFLGVYHVYDGFIFPTPKWHDSITNYFKKVNISTKESHGYALLMYLQSKKLIDATEMDIIISTMSNLLERTCKIYSQLDGKSYIPLDETKRCVHFKCTDQLHKGLEKVYYNIQ